MILLDEPLSALDAHTKGAVRAELQELLRELALPTILVTHDFEDAAALADQVGVIVDGRLRQLATPSELVDRPTDAFVASFTGANLLRGTARRLDDDLTLVAARDAASSSTRPTGARARSASSSTRGRSRSAACTSRTRP